MISLLWGIKTRLSTSNSLYGCANPTIKVRSNFNSRPPRPRIDIFFVQRARRVIKVFECYCFSGIMQFVVGFFDCLDTTYGTLNITQSAVKSVMMDHDSLIKRTFDWRGNLLKEIAKEKGSATVASSWKSKNYYYENKREQQSCQLYQCLCTDHGIFRPGQGRILRAARSCHPVCTTLWQVILTWRF